MFLNSYLDTVLRAVVVDASRYAALADQSAESASSYLDSKLHQLLPNVMVSSRVERGLLASATIRYSSLPTIFNLTSQQVEIRAVAPIEK